MRTKDVLLVFVFGIIISGCNFLSISDREAEHLTKMVGATNVTQCGPNHENEVEEIRQQLLGASAKEVLSNLGEPAWTLSLGDDHQASVKFRQDEYVFCDGKKRRVAECGSILEDEKWAYTCEKKKTYCGFGVFFKKGIVSSVQ